MTDKRPPSEIDELSPPPDAEELREAAMLGDRVDEVLRGERPEDPDGTLSLLRLTHASLTEAPALDPERRSVLVEQALDGSRLRPRERQGRRLAPLLALAATLLLALSVSLLVGVPRRDRAPVVAAPPHLLSRPSNDLMGRPFEDRAGASSRLDLVFADRLNGFREQTLGAGRTR